MHRPYISSNTYKTMMKWFALGGCCLALCISAQAMDLLQVYQAAQQQDPTLLAARATAAGERERLPQARSQLLPNVSASMSRNDNHLESTTPNFLGKEQTTNTGYPSRNKTLSLRQALYRPQLSAQYRQSEAQVEDAEAQLQLEEQNLAVRVSGAYFEAMLTHDQLALVLAQQVAYSTQLDAARKSLAAGSGVRTDIDDAQARIDMSLALEVEARQNLTYTLQQLQALINEPIGKLATLNVANLVLTSPDPNQLDDWITRAEQNSPQIHSLKSRVEIARQEVNKAKYGHYPTLDAIAQWSQSESESVTNTASRYTNNSLGVQLNIPIFSGGYVNSSIRQALAAQERAEQTLEVGRRDLSLRVQKEFRGVTENIPKIKALEQALRSADQLVLSSRKSFQAGSRTVIDILNAEQQRVTVLRDLAQARYMYLISKVRLNSLVGIADISSITSINSVLQE
jgi:outer membrane protein/protease secretion system outer membrane protein